MAATKGNRFWEMRSSHGRKPKFESPGQLWSAACEYFSWVEDNPLTEYKVTQFQGAPIQMEVPKMRAMTVNGLCLFLDIGEQTLANYEKNEDFLGVVKAIKKVMYDQKLTGAAADLLNSNIIARELGLADKQDVSKKSVSVEISKDTNPQEAADIYKDLMG